MTNREYYGDKILDVLESGSLNFGLNKYTDEIVRCRELDCKDCKFLKCSDVCPKIIANWLKEEYCPSTDWSKVEIDTKILVSGDGTYWNRRYFAEVIDGRVFAFPDGTTSWSCDADSIAIEWKYAKLYDESEE